MRLNTADDIPCQIGEAAINLWLFWKQVLIYTSSLRVTYIQTTTVQKVSVFEVFLVRIFPHSDRIRRDTPSYSARMQESTDQKNSEYGHFLPSVFYVWRVNETQYKVKITLKKFSFQIYTEFFQTIIEFDIRFRIIFNSRFTLKSGCHIPKKLLLFASKKALENWWIVLFISS